jgi:predicted transcriptional regulator
MKLRTVLPLIEGRLLSKDADLDIEVSWGAAADLMSDVLAFAKPNALLLTGLTNPQVIRTAEMAEAAAIVFVRGKTPTEDIVRLAEEKRIALIVCKYTMFETCGKLYEADLRGSDPLPCSDGDW